MNMALRAGYKQTEVGVIPEDWCVATLGEIVNYAKGYPFKSSEYERDGIRVIRVSDTSYDSILEDNPVYVSERKAVIYAKWSLSINDLVISTVGSKPPMYSSMVGKIIAIPARHAGALLNQNAVLIRDKKHRAHFPLLLINHFRTKRYFSHIEEIFRGNANQASITLKDLFQFVIPLPSSDAEQRAIATALSDVDALLAAQDKLIAKKRDIKQAAMQQLLTGKQRLPGFGGEWDVKRLGGVLSRMANGAVYKATTSSGVCITRIETISDGTIDYSRTGTAVPSTVLDKYKLLSGDILFSHINSLDHIGKVALFDGQRELYHGMNLLLLRASENMSSKFLYFWLTSESARKKARNLAKQAVSQASINTTELKDMEISIPQLTEQTAIATALSDMDADLTALTQQRDKTRALKQGMMQELLTGRIRLV
ncbi:MAG: restriction endonuclease subunit S [Gallionella sp.]